MAAITIAIAHCRTKPSAATGRPPWAAALPIRPLATARTTAAGGAWKMTAADPTSIVPAIRPPNKIAVTRRPLGASAMFGLPARGFAFRGQELSGVRTYGNGVCNEVLQMRPDLPPARAQMNQLQAFVFRRTAQLED